MPSQRLLTTWLLLLAGGILTVGFIGGISNYTIVGYIFLGVFYISVLIYYRFYHPNSKEAAILVVVTVLIGQLLVIDPVEPGLYGRDAYGTLRVFDGYFREPLIQTITLTRGWPLFYFLTESIRVILDVRIIDLAKYLPLITVSIPLFAFLIAQRLLSDKFSAFVVGMSAASLKTMLLFETKFVDETIALILFFTAIFLITIRNKPSIRYRIVLVLLSVGIVLSHPMTGVIFIGFGILFYIGATREMYKFLPRSQSRFSLISSKQIRISDSLVVINIVLFSFIYAMIITEITIAVLLGGSTPEASVGPSRSQIVLSTLLVDIPLIVVILILAGILLWAFFSMYKMADWELSLSIICGLFTGYYAIGILVGPPIGFDPSRVLIYLIPFLFLTAASVLLRSSQFSLLQARRVLAIVLAVFLVGQVMAIPPHVLYSNPAETVPNTDRNPTLQGQAAVAWGVKANYNAFVFLNSDEIAVRDSDLLQFVDSRCPTPALNRNDIPTDFGNYQNSLTTSNLIYNNGKVSLGVC